MADEKKPEIETPLETPFDPAEFDETDPLALDDLPDEIEL